MNADAYTREELARVDYSNSPDRGPLCPCCGIRIPVFADISPDTEREIRKFDFSAQKRAVRKMTGCSIGWAKIWVLHPDGPRQRVMGPPCPYCGKELFTTQTKQCLQCGWDWHDPSHPVRHVVKKLPPRTHALRIATPNAPPTG